MESFLSVERINMIEKKINLLIFLIFLFLNNMLFAKQQVTIYGDDNYPPYSYQKNGHAQGIYVDILKLVFSKMKNYEVTIKMLPWKRGISYLKNDEIFALFPPYYDQNRALWMLFSESILREEILIYGKKENLEGRKNWPEDFYGSTIGLNRGFTPYGMGGETFGDAIIAGKIKIEEANNTEQNLKKLERDRFNFYLYDKFLDIAAYPSIKRGMVVNTNHGHLGFSIENISYKYKNDFISTFDQIMKKLKKTNEINKIIKKYSK